MATITSAAATQTLSRGAKVKHGHRPRLDHVDAMRPLKQLGVIFTHTLLFFAPAASLAAGGSLLLLHVTREAFLFISACMLAYSYNSLQRDGYRAFYKRRFVSVTIPYLCWTFIYFFMTLHGSSFTLHSGLIHFAYLAGTGYYQLYYLVVIMEFYLLFPLFLALIHRTKGHHRALLITSGLIQIVMMSLIHWNVLPPAMRGFWANREITSYQFYLIAGMVVAFHFNAFHDWVCAHKKLILLSTLGTIIIAEAWFVLAAHQTFSWLGLSSDPFQPITIPFNIGAIACVYILGVYLVDKHRSTTVRAIVRSGSDNSYGIYVAQMIFINLLIWAGWERLAGTVPWPLLSLMTVILVFSACVLLTSVLARTPLSTALTGRRRQSWSTWLPERWRSSPTDAAVLASETIVSSPIDPEPPISH